MDRLLKDADKQAQQREAAQRAEEAEAADQAKKQGQVEYIRSLGKPGERALQAFRAAGVPLGHLPPELVVAFEHRADGTFVDPPTAAEQKHSTETPAPKYKQNTDRGITDLRARIMSRGF